jgi:hypothetical protein
MLTPVACLDDAQRRGLVSHRRIENRQAARRRNVGGAAHQEGNASHCPNDGLRYCARGGMLFMNLLICNMRKP